MHHADVVAMLRNQGIILNALTKVKGSLEVVQSTIVIAVPIEIIADPAVVSALNGAIAGCARVVQQGEQAVNGRRNGHDTHTKAGENHSFGWGRNKIVKKKITVKQTCGRFTAMPRYLLWGFYPEVISDLLRGYAAYG
jgi:hypothetical protein